VRASVSPLRPSGEVLLRERGFIGETSGPEALVIGVGTENVIGVEMENAVAQPLRRNG
jgi:hypothetical protein